MFLIYCDIDSECSEAAKPLGIASHSHEGGGRQTAQKTCDILDRTGHISMFGDLESFGFCFFKHSWQPEMKSGIWSVYPSLACGDLCIHNPEFSKVKGSVDLMHKENANACSHTHTKRFI